MSISLERIKTGLSFENYFAQMKRRFEENANQLLSDEESINHHLVKLNISRVNRNLKQFSPSEKTQKIISSINQKQYWFILSEDWCGDSAQILPIVSQVALLNPLISIHIFERDSNLDLMEKYLSDGKQSIPILAAFDETGNELFKWGSRPKIAVDLVSDLKSRGFSKEEFLENLHSWYAKNKGIEIENEIVSLITSAFQQRAALLPASELTFQQ
ncbi:MAG: thioredoxin family protein [Chlorobiaceae bacterium]|nr:thioredoxin family protein [Chlorobiaceae bacterium]MBA4310642.1 thioredoxin family protein [Chlorobiaceae bacterium]